MNRGDIEVGSYPNEGRVGFTQIGDWSLCIPMSHTARTLYTILRSLVNEKEGPETRKVSDDDLRMAIGISEGIKVPSRTTLYRIRGELIDLDMLQVENLYDRTAGVGAPKIVARRYLVRREPHPGRPYVSSSWTLFNRIAQIREEGASPAEMDSVPYLVRALLGDSVPYTGRSIPQTGRKEALTSDAGFLKKPSGKKPLPPPPPSARLAARRGRGSGRRTEENKIKNFSHTHLDLVKGLVLELPGGVDARQAEEITRLVCAALDRGWAPSAVMAWLAGSCDLERSKIPGAVHLHNARKLGDPSRAQSANAALELCGVCDENGFTQDEGACSGDPLALPGACLHGADDPWDDEEYRARVEAERAEALYAHQKAQQKAREERDRKARESAQRAAQGAGEREQRRREAREFLANAGSLGDEDADAVRALLLLADDPADLEDLDDLVSLALGMLDSGSPVEKVAEVITKVPRTEWKTAFLDGLAPVTA